MTHGCQMLPCRSREGGKAKRKGPERMAPRTLRYLMSLLVAAVDVTPDAALDEPRPAPCATRHARGSGYASSASSQTDSATSRTSLSLSHWTCSAIELPSSVEEKPHCEHGLAARVTQPARLHTKRGGPPGPPFRVDAIVCDLRTSRGRRSRARGRR